MKVMAGMVKSSIPGREGHEQRPTACRCVWKMVSPLVAGHIDSEMKVIQAKAEWNELDARRIWSVE